MKKILLVVGIITILTITLTNCANAELVPATKVSKVDTGNMDTTNIVRIELRNGKISIDTNISVIDYYPGGRAEAVYLIHNGTTKGIKPVIMVNRQSNVRNYEKANNEGFVQATSEEMSWIEIPEMKEVPAGGTKEFIVAYEAPEYFKMKEDKIAFEIDVSYPDVGGQVILSVGNWWLIEMK